MPDDDSSFIVTFSNQQIDIIPGEIESRAVEVNSSQDQIAGALRNSKGPFLREIISNSFAGFISLLMTLIACLSYSSLIFSGDLSPHLNLGIYSALVSAAIVGAVMAARSSSPFTIAGPDANISALFALIALSVGAGASSLRPESVFSTIWVTISISTFLTGLFLYAAGRYRLGKWIRFIPYPVIGGFLAGTGWLLARGSFKVMAGFLPSYENLPMLVQGHYLVRWLPGALLAVILLVVLRRSRHFLVMPSILIGAILIGHLWLFSAGISFEQARLDGWLLPMLPDNFISNTWHSLSPGEIEWNSLISSAGNLSALMIVAAIVILLNAASIEISTQSDIDVDHELKSTGLGNLLAAPCGGLVGCIALSRTLLNWKAGASSRLSGFISALMSAAVLCIGASYLSYVPKPVLGALLLYLGLGLIIEWIYDGWSRFSRFDYFLVLSIFFMIAATGFLPGIGIGIVAACMLFAFNYSRTKIIRHELSGTGHGSSIERSSQEQQILDAKGDQIYVLVLQGFIFFGTAYPLLSHIQERIGAANRLPVRFILLDFTYISGLDSSSVLIFKKMAQICRAANVTIFFVNTEHKIEMLLEEGGCSIVKNIESEQNDGPCCSSFQDLDHALGWCEEQILSGKRIDDSLPSFEILFSEVFGGCASSIAELEPYLEKVVLPAGAVLCRQGDISRDLYFLESGQVTITLNRGGTKTKRLRSMKSGTIVGEMAFYLGKPRSGTIIADKQCIIHKLSADSFNRLEQEERELAFAIHKYIVRLLAVRLAYTNERLSQLKI